MTHAPLHNHRIVILMPLLDFSFRNVVYSGMLEHLLKENVEVYLLLHNMEPSFPSDLKNRFQVNANCQPLLVPALKRSVKGLSFVRDVIGNAFSKRNKISSYHLYQRWESRSISTIQRLRKILIEILGFLAQPAPIFFSLYRIYDYFYRLKHDLIPISQQLHSIAPDLLLSTINVVPTYERAYILSAKDLSIPVVNSVLSFDNLTTKPIHLLYNYYLVWNQGMKEQLLRFYPQVQAKQIYITGTPQFDFHRRVDCLWSRQETLDRLGLPAGAKYFLYGASPKTLTPDEPKLVSLLADKMQTDDVLCDYWLVVRTHPRDDWERWQTGGEPSPRLILSKALKASAEENGSVFPTLDDQMRLTGSLAYSEACLNIASTMTLDAAILDRPVIGIRFDKESDAPREILYKEYDTDHYRPLVESGGLRLAHSWDELLGLMKQATQDPGRDCLARQKMVAQECGAVDGCAAQRMADTLMDCLGKTHG